MEKVITAECDNCESSFQLSFEEDFVSDDLPCFCPFCGERIEDLVEEEYIEDEDFNENEEWE